MTDNCNPYYFCQLMLWQCHIPHLEVGIRVIECLRMNSDVRIYRGSPYRHRKESFESIPKLSDPTTTLQSLPKANRDGWKTDSRPYSMHPARPIMIYLSWNHPTRAHIYHQQCWRLQHYRILYSPSPTGFTGVTLILERLLAKRLVRLTGRTFYRRDNIAVFFFARSLITHCWNLADASSLSTRFAYASSLETRESFSRDRGIRTCKILIFSPVPPSALN